MIEFIKHAFGLCGDAHINITDVIFGTYLELSYIKEVFKNLFRSSIKNI